jgi:Tol biopolymer transport system component/DNA-binding winged helix-turn-helix (wHTH) protein
MPNQVGTSQVIRFATFEVDLQAQEVRKARLRLKLTGQPFQVLAILLEQPGTVITREELQKRLWPDTFVDVDHNLNTAINKIREALGDSSENPRFVETLPRRGYRFIGPITASGTAAAEVVQAAESRSTGRPESAARTRRLLGVALLGTVVLLVAGGFWIYKWRETAAAPSQRMLTRITFDEGLQNQPTWSPDGRYIAYSSDRGGKFDLWVQQVSGGNPVQITRGPGQHSQADWSPDGRFLAYRADDAESGLFVAPALGGDGLERKLASFGYYPRWSPDSSQLLFQTHFVGIDATNRFYVVSLDGGPPREVLADFIREHKLRPGRAAWCPDGRISLWVWDPKPSPRIWTVSLEGDSTPIQVEIPPSIQQQFAEVAKSGTVVEHHGEMSFAWSPKADAVYFESGYQGAINLWKLAVDPKTMRATAVHRLTTGPGADSTLAISSDGGRLAFTAKAERIRNWLFPFDPRAGRITGPGQPLTAPGRTALVPSMSRDGKKVAFSIDLAGRFELWEKSLIDGREAPLVADDYDRRYAQWSPDATRLAYTRRSISSGEQQLMVWSFTNHSEEPLTTLGKTDTLIHDWSPDGRSLLVSKEGTNQLREIWEIPLAAAPHAERAARKVAADPAYLLYQPHYSPNGRWVVFEAVSNSPTAARSSLYAVSAIGGPWKQITDGSGWDDKPRWSADGKTIYFVSGKGFFFDVWGIRFDPERSEQLGKPFRVTTFDRPSLMIPRWIPPVALSISQNKLLLTMSESSGGIWLLDNVDR